MSELKDSWLSSLTTRDSGAAHSRRRRWPIVRLVTGGASGAIGVQHRTLLGGTRPLTEMPVACIHLGVTVAGGHTGASTAMRCWRSIPSPSRSPLRWLERRSTTHGAHDGTDLSADRQARRPEPHP